MVKLLSTTPLPLKIHPPFPTVLPLNALSWHYPTPHIHSETANKYFKITSNTKKTEKTWKWMIVLISTTPMSLKLFPLFIQKLTHNNLARQYPTTHIHWEITIFMPPPPPPKKRKSQNYKWMIKLLSTTPLTPMHHPALPTMLPPYPLSQQSPTTHIIWEIAINISKLP